jgi:hypothetical protein
MGPASCTFREFIEAEPLRGLGEKIDDVERLIADDDRAVTTFRKMTVDPRGGDRKSDEIKNNNIIFDSDLLTPDESPEKKAVQGTSRAYTLSRLDRERPDLFELVVQGEMSANAAAIMAGAESRFGLNDSYSY